jgi:hypothetical protein
VTLSNSISGSTKLPVAAAVAGVLHQLVNGLNVALERVGRRRHVRALIARILPAFA